MKKLTTEQQADLAEFVGDLRQKGEALTQAVADFNALLEEGRGRVEAELAAYNESVREADEFRDGVFTKMSDYSSERSEKWQEGEQGSLYAAWMDLWEDTIDEVEIDLPEDIEEPELAAADLLEGLPVEP